MSKVVSSLHCHTPTTEDINMWRVNYGEELLWKKTAYLSWSISVSLSLWLLFGLCCWPITVGLPVLVCLFRSTSFHLSLFPFLCWLMSVSVSQLSCLCWLVSLGLSSFVPLCFSFSFGLYSLFWLMSCSLSLSFCLCWLVSNQSLSISVGHLSFGLSLLRYQFFFPVQYFHSLHCGHYLNSCNRLRLELNLRLKVE